MPTGSIVTVDGRVARHTAYLPYINSSEVPFYDAIAQRGTLFQHYQAAFDRVWLQASGKVAIHENFQELATARQNIGNS
jgi:hypothetical protein